MKSKEVKQQEALERQSFYANLSVEEKLKRLDKMFGKGKGALRQRSKLINSKE